jgi:hypothetical protein
MALQPVAPCPRAAGQSPPRAAGPSALQPAARGRNTQSRLAGAQRLDRKVCKLGQE